ncbi:hypothetical protein [Sphingobium sp. LB126]|uniref:hypothetical protein n=1 Tax=Sphingobium sp. LB126 TaxID=1983755 RepID=UPI0012FD9D5D|nr:hypothetical protein [Sphingobium sp. LB126]
MTSGVEKFGRARTAVGISPPIFFKLQICACLRILAAVTYQAQEQIPIESVGMFDGQCRAIIPLCFEIAVSMSDSVRKNHAKY